MVLDGISSPEGKFKPQRLGRITLPQETNISRCQQLGLSGNVAETKVPTAVPCSTRVSSSKFASANIHPIQEVQTQGGREQRIRAKKQGTPRQKTHTHTRIIYIYISNI